jgi:hypothetical protein
MRKREKDSQLPLHAFDKMGYILDGVKEMKRGIIVAWGRKEKGVAAATSLRPWFFFSCNCEEK